MAQDYQEHWDRTKRWFARLQSTERGRKFDRPSDDYQDDVYAFFVTCYHFKDWLKNDPAVSAVRSKVEPFINSTTSLQICADICNGHKHLQLTSNRSGQNPQMGRRHFSIEAGPAGQQISISFTVDTKSGPMDAFRLAEECMVAWKKFLTGNGLNT